MRWAEGDREQCQHTAHQVQTMGGSEDIEKAAARIRLQIDPLGDKLPPGDHLANEEEDAEHGRPPPPVAESVFVVRAERAARTSQCETAGNEDHRVEPEDVGDVERYPRAVRHALA